MVWILSKLTTYFGMLHLYLENMYVVIMPR